MKPRTINRNRNAVPRKIRELKTNRQLSRLTKQQHHDDDWWSDDNGSVTGGGASPTRRRFGKRLIFSGYDEDDEDDDEHTRRGKIARICALMARCLVVIYAKLKHLYTRIRETPPQIRRKRFVLAFVLFCVLRNVLIANLGQYSSYYSKNISPKSSHGSMKQQEIDDIFGTSKTQSKSMGVSGSSSLTSSYGNGSNGLRGASSAITSSLGNMFKKPNIGGIQQHQSSYSNTGIQQQPQSSYSGTRPLSKYTIADTGNKFGSSNSFGISSSNTGMQTPHQLGNSLGGVQSQTVLTSSQTQSQYNSPQVQSNQLQHKHGSNLGIPPSNLGVQSSQLSGSLGGVQSQTPLTGSQSQTQYNAPQIQNQIQYNPPKIQQPRAQYSSSLRGQSSFGNSQSILGSGNGASGSFNSQGIGSTYSNSDNLNSLKSPFPTGGLQTSNQFSKNAASQGKSGINQKVDLQCAGHGGPNTEAEYAEIVYWRNIPSDSSFQSSYYNKQAQEASSGSFWKAKYLTFEMDDAGWNNMRLGLENVILMAHSMGRTLVLPPKRQMAHGMMDKNGSKIVSFQDFYDISAINNKQKGLNIITMEQFLEREAVDGHLTDKNGNIMYPPNNNQVKWNNQPLQPLWDYIRNVSKSTKWHPRNCVLAFPSSTNDSTVSKLTRIPAMMDDVLDSKDGRPFPDYTEYQARPVNVDAPSIERFREILAGRRQICMYEKDLHDQNSVLHFGADQFDGTRLITPFYAFLWFEDWKHDLWSKRFVRDNLRYNDEIMCLAARVIRALRTRASKQSIGNINGDYDAIHIRRGDFQKQFTMTKMDASEILAGLKDTITPGHTLFIATDERDLTFFSSIKEVYDVAFLGDFGTLLNDINPNYFPLVEQIVASRGRIFIGTFYSTFSAYISRLRGYYTVKETHDTSGSLKTTLFLPAKYKKEMRLYQALHEPLFGREFPIAWRDIDRLELPSSQLITLNNIF